ncbi:hypothetical protein ACQY0O_000421 [Thecaphora frezii]
MSNPSATRPNDEMAVHHFVSGLVPPQTESLAALPTSNFDAAREGHPPPGTIPDSILPKGVEKPLLFTPFSLPYTRTQEGDGKQTYKNRVVISPMCQYSSHDGFPSPYHIAHLGSFALHGAGNIMVEAAGVVPEGRITPQCLGIWSEAHRDAHKALVSSLKSFTDGLAMGIQLAHAGRKASDWSPFHRGEKKFETYVTEEEGGWPDRVVAPSALAYDSNHITPKELSGDDIKQLQERYLQAARWSFEAGYDYVEVHAAHGYLFHSFLSPLTNRRTDEYGGSFENRARFLIDTIKAVRSEFPDKGLWVRISSTDFAEGAPQNEGRESWTVEQSVKLAHVLNDLGVDLIDVSGAGLVPYQKIDLGPGYQLFGSRAIRKALVEKVGQEGKRMLVGGVGMLEGSEEFNNAHDPSITGTYAEKSLKQGDCDVIFLARGMMANPKWTEDAAVALTGVRCAVNPQYYSVQPVKRSQR